MGKKLLGRHALGGDFGGLFLYLGFLGLNLEIWSKKNKREKNEEQTKKEETIDCTTGGRAP